MVRTLQRKCFLKALLPVLFLAGSVVGASGQTFSNDLTSPELWKPNRVPFSFKYDGKESGQLLTSWQTSQENVAGKNGQIQRYIYMDPATHLKVTDDVRLYPDFPGVIDWVLRFRNDGTT